MRTTRGVEGKGWPILLVLDAMTSFREKRYTVASQRLSEAKEMIQRLLLQRQPPGIRHIHFARDVYMAEVLAREAERLLSGPTLLDTSAD